VACRPRKTKPRRVAFDRFFALKALKTWRVRLAGGWLRRLQVSLNFPGPGLERANRAVLLRAVDATDQVARNLASLFIANISRGCSSKLIGGRAFSVTAS
jgi:hypothetical protein